MAGESGNCSGRGSVRIGVFVLLVFILGVLAGQSVRLPSPTQKEGVVTHERLSQAEARLLGRLQQVEKRISEEVATRLEKLREADMKFVERLGQAEMKITDRLGQAKARIEGLGQPAGVEKKSEQPAQHGTVRALSKPPPPPPPPPPPKAKAPVP
eukprot:Hpha_TRINITY_DN15035_c1_g1::TRINITY_DN15035_c1_g1_i1::g.123061::m.123061